jgi:hypothetical protein
VAQSRAVPFARFGLLIAAAATVAIALPSSAQAATSFAFHSLGPSGGNGAFDAAFQGASADGTHVFFTTDESLVPADTDTSTDVYESTGGGVFLRSDSTAGGVDPNTPISWGGVSPSGRAFFHTSEPLTPATDADLQTDVYASTSGANPIQVSRGVTGGNGAFGASFGGSAFGIPGGSSDDGNRVFFETAEQLVVADGDAQTDVYRWDIATSTVTLMTPSTTTSFANYAANSHDGTQVAIGTGQVLDASDADGGQDLYRFNGSTYSPISTDGAPGAPSNGDGGQPAFIVGASDSFDKFAFASIEQLAATDSTDTKFDIWFKQIGQPLQHATPNTAVALPASFAFMSGDGKVFFTSGEAVLASDTDGQPDVYQFAGGVDTLVSTGQPGSPGAFQAALGGFTADGNHVYFSTAEQMTPATDTDASVDVYDRVNGTTTVHVSQGQQNGNGAFDATFAGVPSDRTHGGASADGARVFFMSTEQLTSDDTDVAKTDVFERSGGATSRVSSGPNGGNGAFDATIADTNAAGTRAVFSSLEHLFATDTDAQVDLFGWELTLPVPTVTTAASGNVTLGGAVSDSATVSGRVNPVAGATVDFKLYGPDDATCAGTPVFQSLGQALSAGGTAASAAFTPTAVGTYRWRAFYNGDVNNAPAGGACNDPNESVIVTAAGGGGGGGGGRDVTSPSVTAYTLTNRVFRVGTGATPITGVAAARRRKPPIGTTFRYRLSEPAKVVIDVQRVLPGRRSGRRCVAPSTRLRRARKCTRFVSQGKLTRTSRAGARRVAFSGRIGKRPLKPGSYRAVLIATDAAGNRSTAKSVTFTVVRA